MNDTMLLMRLEQFAWLLDNGREPRNHSRLLVLWAWADEMVHFQLEANATGKPVEYRQRGEVVRTLNPETAPPGKTGLPYGTIVVPRGKADA